MIDRVQHNPPTLVVHIRFQHMRAPMHITVCVTVLVMIAVHVDSAPFTARAGRVQRLMVKQKQLELELFKVARSSSLGGTLVIAAAKTTARPITVGRRGRRNRPADDHGERGRRAVGQARAAQRLPSTPVHRLRAIRSRLMQIKVNGTVGWLLYLGDN